MITRPRMRGMSTSKIRMPAKANSGRDKAAIESARGIYVPKGWAPNLRD